jgi:hypothetical protein
MNKHMCFKKNGKPRRGVSHRYENCQVKSRFRAVRDAIQSADRFVDRVLWGSAPVVPYFCPAHSCWHIGHDRKMDTVLAKSYEASCISRERLRSEIKGLSETLKLFEQPAEHHRSRDVHQNECWAPRQPKRKE